MFFLISQILLHGIIYLINNGGTLSGKYNGKIYIIGKENYIKTTGTIGTFYIADKIYKEYANFNDNLWDVLIGNNGIEIYYNNTNSVIADYVDINDEIIAFVGNCMRIPTRAINKLQIDNIITHKIFDINYNFDGGGRVTCICKNLYLIIGSEYYINGMKYVGNRFVYVNEINKMNIVNVMNDTNNMKDVNNINVTKNVKISNLGFSIDYSDGCSISSALNKLYSPCAFDLININACNGSVRLNNSGTDFDIILNGVKTTIFRGSENIFKIYNSVTMSIIYNSYPYIFYHLPKLTNCCNCTNCDANCKCFSGFIGDNCEKHDCGYGKYVNNTCVCVDFWKGDKCECNCVNISIECVNICKCRDGWKGWNCSEYDCACDKCAFPGYCLCNYPHIGKICDKCVYPFILIGSDCVCSFGFIGNECENSIISLISIIVFIFLVIIFILLIFTHNKSINKLSNSIIKNRINLPLFKLSDVKDLNEIGSGSSSIVYSGILNDKKVAIKLFKHLDDTYQKEYEIISSLSHKNIVKYIGLIDEPIGIIYEYCEKIDKNVSLNKIIMGIINGMIYLHDNNIIHKDLKPENILVKNGEIKIIDFGISTKNNTLNSGLGTPRYMAPEIYYGDVDFSCDVYSFGITIKEIIENKNMVCVSELDKIIETCLNQKSYLRPTFKELKKKLKQVFKN